MSGKELKEESYLKLSPGVSVKTLESPYLYDAITDELYEINEEAVEFLMSCDGDTKVRDLCYDEDFVEYCLEEGLLEFDDEPSPRMIENYRSPVPSLRYLEFQITHRCNKKCKHCYIGPAKDVDMPGEKVLNALSQFEQMGGLRVMISGGEPLLHPEWEYINSEMERFEIRRVLFSNGELIKPETAWRLAVHEVQISIDGMRKGHDALRGAGSWKKAMMGAVNVIETGLDLSVSTMIHSGNLDEFDEMNVLFQEIGVREWGIDIPCVAGRLTKKSKIIPSIEEAAPLLRFAYGGSFHGGREGYGCGLHLATLTPQGKMLKCGFYLDEPLGTLKEGMKKAWKRNKPMKIEELTECAGCEFLMDCGGGCRFRATSPTAPDPVMCHFYKSQKK